MSAVAEAPAVDYTFTMPKPMRGSSVLWYPHGDTSEEPEVAFVIKIGNRNVVIRLASGTLRESVRHTADPKLQQSAAQRENGAWDFTDETKKVLALDERVKTLEAQLSARASRAAKE